MILRFSSGSVHPFERARGTSRRRRGSTLTCMCSAKVSITCFASFEPQQAVVDEHAGELIADRLVDQRRGHRGIDAAGQAEDHPSLPTCSRMRGHGFERRSRACSSRRGSRRSRARSAAGASLPAARVRHLGVELHAVEAARLVRHAGDRAGVGGGHQLEARRQRTTLSPWLIHTFEQAVAFGVRILDAVEQRGWPARAPRRSRTRAPVPARRLPPSCCAMVCMP